MSRQNCSQLYVYDSFSKCHDKTVANYMCMTRSLNFFNKTVANCMFVTRSLNVTNKTVANCMCMIRSLNVTNKTVATLLQIATVHSSS